MQQFSASTRTANLRSLAQDQFDVLVIGGGITGAGVALDAAAHGYRVALVEKADFASGTSSKSTKLVHGGIRYLPLFDFGLVHEALVERGLLIRNAPFLVEPLVFLLPLYQGAKRPVGVPIAPPGGVGLGLILDMGLWMYDLMAGRHGVARHRRISAKAALALTPALNPMGLKEAFLYSDAQTNDTGLTMTVLRTAAQHGSVIANYAEVVGFVRHGERLSGAHVRDMLTGATFTVAARHVVNATGIFAQRVEGLAGDESKVTIEPSKGVHLVVARERVGIRQTAVVIPETDDGRILFVLPWGARAVIGTTDTGEGDLDDPEASPQDIAYLLDHANRVLDAQLTEDDILSVYAGYRPLVKSKEDHTANLSRSHVVLEQKVNGMVTVVGGKLTTYRRMAQDVVDVLAQRDRLPRSHPTERLLLAGAIGWPEARPEIEARGRALGLAPDTLRHLAFNYGRDAMAVLDLIDQDELLSERLVADLPYIRAEVLHAVRYEMALRLDDVLARRTRISVEDRDRGARVAGDVARLMAGELGWSLDRIRAEEDQYAAQIRHHLSAEGLARR